MKQSGACCSGLLLFEEVLHLLLLNLVLLQQTMSFALPAALEVCLPVNAALPLQMLHLLLMLRLGCHSPVGCCGSAATSSEFQCCLCCEQRIMHWSGCDVYQHAIDKKL